MEEESHDYLMANIKQIDSIHGGNNRVNIEVRVQGKIWQFYSSK